MLRIGITTQVCQTYLVRQTERGYWAGKDGMKGIGSQDLNQSPCTLLLLHNAPGLSFGKGVNRVKY
jgi:hypothetical protein